MAHFAVRKDKRDGSVLKKTAEAVRWIFDNTTCEAIMAFINEDNKAARSILAQGGLTVIGTTKGTVRFGGKLCNEVIYQMTKEEFDVLWNEGRY